MNCAISIWEANKKGKRPFFPREATFPQKGCCFQGFIHPDQWYHELCRTHLDRQGYIVAVKKYISDVKKRCIGHISMCGFQIRMPSTHHFPKKGKSVFVVCFS